MKKFFLLAFLLIGFSFASFPQQPSLTLPHVTGINAGDTVLVPLTAKDIAGWGSLAYEDPSYWNFVAQYLSYTIIDPDLTSGFVNVNYTPGGATDWLVMSWFSTTPLVALDDTLFLLHFLYYGGYTPLTFTPLPNITTNDGSLGGSVGIPGAEASAEALEIFPNPVKARGILRLTAPAGNYLLHVYNAQGQILIRENIQIAPFGQHELSLHGLAASACFVRLQGESRVYSGKFIQY